MADNVALVEQAYEAFGRGDVEAFLEVFDENVEWLPAESSPYWTGAALRGPGAVVEGVFAPLAQATESFQLVLHRVVGAGDTVLVEGRYTGRRTATGTDFDIQMCHVWDFRDGRLVHWQQYTDTLGWARVTGGAV
ncbi:MAG: nuclear transport factor 2 family protein [Pseudonocardia sp.]|nr:nuclear transport factor 2 family protein [Pseudonocardia sp.]